MTAVDINGNTLYLNGTLSGNPGTITGSNTSGLMIGGTGNLGGPLRFTAGNRLLASLTLNWGLNGMGQATLATPLALVGGVNALTLTNGLLNTSSNALLTLNAASGVSDGGPHKSGGWNGSHLNGPMAKVVNSTANFTFPVGNFGYLGEIGITPTSSTATTFTAQYFRQTAYIYGDGNVEDPLHHVSALEHWTLDRESVLNAAAGQVTLHWTTDSMFRQVHLSGKS